MENKNIKSKIENFKDYAKCVYTNKFTLTGYIGISTAIVGVIFQNEIKSYNIPEIALTTICAINAAYGWTALRFTKFGHETLESYREGKKHIKTYRKMSHVYYGKNTMYCNRVGARLAAREAGLEEIIEKK